jgi:hypothetical protein
VDQINATAPRSKLMVTTGRVMIALVFIVFVLFLFVPSFPGGSMLLFVAIALLPLAGLLFIYRKYTQGRQIELKFDKPAYSFDEAVTGTVILNLEKEVQARGLKVRFYGAKREGRYIVRFCMIEFSLAEARTFRKGESFRFSIPVPSSARQSVETLQTLAGPSWHVEAQLDIPNGIDMIKTEMVKLQQKL